VEKLSPPEQISRMLTGYWITQALYVAAKLGLADLAEAAAANASGPGHTS
jgi:hypothetical protein